MDTLSTPAGVLRDEAVAARDLATATTLTHGVAPAGRIAVVGIGADGWAGLAPRSAAAITAAGVIFGSSRQLDLVAPHVRAELVPWPIPLMPQLRDLLDAHSHRQICVLASGDPMFHGIGVTLARLFGIGRLDVYPHPSSASLACARLGWSLARTRVISLVNRDVAELADLIPGEPVPILLLSRDETTPRQVAALLRELGWTNTKLTVLEQLGGPDEKIHCTTADGWDPDTVVGPLNVIALEVVDGPGRTITTRAPGLANEIYESDGQLTKSEVRAVTLSALSPMPDQLLWDVGGGSGSIAIEWLRLHRRGQARTFEARPDRRERISRNARTLGAQRLRISGPAPESFPEDERPDAIFIGGGVSQPGMIEACWERLAPGGRLVVNAVTLESESVLVQWQRERGGQLRKIQISDAAPLGRLHTWRAQLPVTQWIAVKP